MYKKFRVNKKTGTYSDTIEAFGLANLINEIQTRANLKRPKLWIEDKGLYYELTSKPEIKDEDISSIKYFPIFQNVKRESKEKIEGKYFDYQEQKQLRNERRELIQKAYNDFSGKVKADKLASELKRIQQIYEAEKYISPQLDVYGQIIPNNNFGVFKKLYSNFSNNPDYFPEIIKAICNYYSNEPFELDFKKKSSLTTSVTALQLYNPTTGKGQNWDKAKSASPKQINLNWISETMKISGALTNMLCQSVKVGSKFDLKIVVPDFKKAEYNSQKRISLGFKKNIKGNTPIKIDILNLLIILKQLIEHAEDYQNFKAKNILTGLHSTYQKSLGQNKAVVNISQLKTPAFIAFDSKKESNDWIDFLNNNIEIIGSIDEIGDATQGLIAYRTFFTSSVFSNWAKFTFWYSEHLMSILSKNKYAISFKINTLNKFFNNMSMKNYKISEVTSNLGFQKVAAAIRNSTVILQGAKSRGQKIEFEIRYGIAQELQNKSRTKLDLAEYIGSLIGTYNAETARKAELKKAFRKPVRENELNEFYSLLDSYPSKVVGALLASYGFALEEKEAEEKKDKTESNENNNQ